MKKTLIIALAIFSNFIFAQVYTEATLYLRDGSKLEGFADIPLGPKDGSIRFKEKMDSKSKLIQSKEIAKASYNTIKNEKIVFERLASVYWRKNKLGEIESVKYEKEAWLWQYRSHKKLNLYLSYPKYKLTKEGDLQLIYYSNGGGGFAMGEGPGYFKRPNENVATTSIIMTLSRTKLINHLGAYFSDIEEMKGDIQKIIKEDVFKLYSSNFLFEEYIKY
jgi:hypothetical protein